MRMSASVGADGENKAKAEVNASAFVVCIGCLVGIDGLVGALVVSHRFSTLS
jgi:hypothetical protein